MSIDGTARSNHSKYLSQCGQLVHVCVFQVRQLSNPLASHHPSNSSATVFGLISSTPFLSSSHPPVTPSASGSSFVAESSPMTTRTALTPTSGSLKLTVNRRLQQTSSLTNHARVSSGSLHLRQNMIGWLLVDLKIRSIDIFRPRFALM